uniref:Uncharacterized protein n=1 Tax=Sipha flava TaxID=143950 RepID=A0A2S2QLN7_9HEMI
MRERRQTRVIRGCFTADASKIARSRGNVRDVRVILVGGDAFVYRPALAAVTESLDGCKCSPREPFYVPGTGREGRIGFHETNNGARVVPIVYPVTNVTCSIM